ncbi:hypothetical protein TNCV_3662781 [Trichonephila clavipes]|nr:hypothetical protein TNCV_3662781 [Trichonephila clavipes]
MPLERIDETSIHRCSTMGRDSLAVKYHFTRKVRSFVFRKKVSMPFSEQSRAAIKLDDWLELIKGGRCMDERKDGYVVIF